MQHKRLLVFAAISGLSVAGCRSLIDLAHQADELHKTAIEAKGKANWYAWPKVDACQEAAITALRSANRAITSKISYDRKRALLDNERMLGDCKKAGIEPGRPFVQPTMEDTMDMHPARDMEVRG